MTSSQNAADRLTAAAVARGAKDLATLRRYAGHETPTGDAAALDAFAEVLVADAAAIGAVGRRMKLPSGDLVVIDHPGRGAGRVLPPALLLAHHDTVHPVGSLVGAVPLREEDGRLHGPGVHDMKGGIVVAFAAMEILAELALDHRPIRLLVTPDEEVGSPASRETITRMAAGAAFALGLEPPHPGGGLKTSRRGSTRLRVAVVGRASHAAVAPEAGVSAIDELVDQLLVVREVLSGYPDVLCNVGTVTGGGRTNVVPDAAAAELGLRFVALDTEQEVLGRLGGLSAIREGATVEVAVLSNRPAWGPSAATEELLARVAVAAGAVGQSVTGSAADGAADTNLTGAAGVPSLDGFGPLGGGAHAVTEHVVIASLGERAALLASVLHRV